MGGAFVILLTCLLVTGHWGYAALLVAFMYITYGDDDVYPKR